MTEEIEQHILRRYDIVKKVGSGAYGHVWKVTDRKTGQTLALKKIFDAFQHTTDAQRTYRQIMFLKQFDHQNIISLLHVFRAENDKDIYLVFEFMEADLHNVIRQNILQDIHKQYVIYQTALALKYLHSGEVIHRDLKPSNILLNSECFVKICDFGLVRSIAKHDDNSPVLTEYVATRWYRAPEILLGANEYNKSVDIWSLGCILAEIMIGKPIFPGSSTLHQLEKILSFTNKPSPEDIDSLKSDLARSMIDTVSNIKYKSPRQWFPSCSDDMIDLVVSMLQFNPSKRLTAEELLRHPYLKQFTGKCPQIVAKKVFRISNDEQKLTTKDYRNLIYENVKEEREAARGMPITKDFTSPTTKYQYTKDVSTTDPKARQTPTSTNSPKSLLTGTSSYVNQRKQKVEELIRESNKQIVRKKNTSNNLKEDLEKAKFPQTTKVLSSIPSTTYSETVNNFLSPKARVTPNSPVASTLKPNSPVYKYVYGNNKESQQYTQPFFSSVKKK